MLAPRTPPSTNASFTLPSNPKSCVIEFAFMSLNFIASNMVFDQNFIPFESLALMPNGSDSWLITAFLSMMLSSKNALC